MWTSHHVRATRTLTLALGPQTLALHLQERGQAVPDELLALPEAGASLAELGLEAERESAAARARYHLRNATTGQSALARLAGLDEGLPSLSPPRSRLYGE